MFSAVKDDITRRGKNAKNIAKVAAARLLTMVFYGMRDGQIRCLSRPRQDPPPAHATRGRMNGRTHGHVAQGRQAFCPPPGARPQAPLPPRPGGRLSIWLTPSDHL